MSSLSGAERQRLIDSARRGSREALGALLEAYRRYLELLARLQVDRRLQGTVASVKNLWTRSLAKLRIQLGDC